MIWCCVCGIPLISEMKYYMTGIKSVVVLCSYNCYEGGRLDAYILGICYNIRGCPQHLPMFPLIKRNIL